LAFRILQLNKIRIPRTEVHSAHSEQTPQSADSPAQKMVSPYTFSPLMISPRRLEDEDRTERWRRIDLNRRNRPGIESEDKTRPKIRRNFFPEENVGNINENTENGNNTDGKFSSEMESSQISGKKKSVLGDISSKLPEKSASERIWRRTENTENICPARLEKAESSRPERDNRISDSSEGIENLNQSEKSVESEQENLIQSEKLDSSENLEFEKNLLERSNQHPKPVETEVLASEKLESEQQQQDGAKNSEMTEEEKKDRRKEEENRRIQKNARRKESGRNK